MAKVVMLRDPKTGQSKKGFYGFSWTMICWGPFAPFIRGDWQTGLIILVLNIVLAFAYLAFVPGLIWAFLWNKQYTSRLLQKGYVFDDRPEIVREAKLKFGMAVESFIPSAAAA